MIDEPSCKYCKKIGFIWNWRNENGKYHGYGGGGVFDKTEKLAQ